MKRIAILVSLVWIAVSVSQAQRPIQERVEAMRSAYITDYLQLSTEEAQMFWPIYNEYKASEKTIRQEYRVKGDIRMMTDQEAEQVVLQGFEREEKLLDLRKEYYQRLQQAVPIRKIALLPEAERKFKEKILKEIQQRRNNNGAGPGNRNQRFNN